MDHEAVVVKLKRSHSSRWPRRSAPWVAGLIAAALLGGQAQAQEQAPEPETFPVGDRAETGPDADRFALGVGIGRGVGLFGGYLSYRVGDAIGFEAAVGKRIFAITMGATDYVYWPTAVAGKLQYYFSRPEAQYQSGLEAGVIYAQDAGVAMEAGYFGRVRLGASMFADFDIGIAIFPGVEERGPQYAADQLGGPSSNYELQSSPVGLLWGLGLGFTF